MLSFLIRKPTHFISHISISPNSTSVCISAKCDKKIQMSKILRVHLSTKKENVRGHILFAISFFFISAYLIYKTKLSVFFSGSEYTLVCFRGVKIPKRGAPLLDGWVG